MNTFLTLEAKLSYNVAYRYFSLLQAQLECLRGLVGEESVKVPTTAEKKRRKKRQRDTW